MWKMVRLSCDPLYYSSHLNVAYWFQWTVNRVHNIIICNHAKKRLGIMDKYRSLHVKTHFCTSHEAQVTNILALKAIKWKFDWIKNWVLCIGTGCHRPNFNIWGMRMPNIFGGLCDVQNMSYSDYSTEHTELTHEITCGDIQLCGWKGEKICCLILLLIFQSSISCANCHLSNFLYIWQCLLTCPWRRCTEEMYMPPWQSAANDIYQKFAIAIDAMPYTQAVLV